MAILQTPFQRAVPLAQRAAAFGAITSSYTLVGAVFTASPVFLYIMSTLDQAVQISWDGVTDAIAVPVGSTVPVYIPIDLKANGIAMSGQFGVYVKEIGNPGAGSLYVGGFTV